MRRIAITVSIAAVLAATRLTLMGQAGPPPQSARDVIVVFHDDESDVDGLAAEHGRAYGASVSQLYHSALRGYAARIPQARLGDVQRDPRVAFVSEDRPVQAVAQTLPTGVDRIDGELSSHAASNSWNTSRSRSSTPGSGPHADLNIAGGKNCSAGKSFATGTVTGRTSPGRSARSTMAPASWAWRRASRSTRSAFSTTRAPAAGHRSFAASTGSPRTRRASTSRSPT